MNTIFQKSQPCLLLFCRNINKRKMSKISQIKEETKSNFTPLKTRSQRKATTVKAKQEIDEAPQEVSNKVKSKSTATKRKTITDKLISNIPEPRMKFEQIKTENILDEKLVKWEPKNWKKTLENLSKMRASQIAPVDSMGCQQCSDDVNEKNRRYHVLISLMLSSQTKDAINHAALQRLREYGLTPGHIIETDDETLEKLIVPVSFYKTKAKHIKKTSLILLTEYDGDIPDTVTNLIKLPGVGPKMAHICMKAAWNQVTGIGVDTHVHRIANRLKWVEKPTKEPEQTRISLEKWLPFELWDEINLMLVGFGQTVCLPRFPLCDTCLNNDICPSREFKTKAAKKN